jgi:tellurite resistance protein
MKRREIVASFLMIIAISLANAQNQPKRIKQGVRSGEITNHERVEIAKQREDVRQAVKVAKADGVITNQEKKIIVAEKRQASKMIYRKKHNNRNRN